MVARRGNCYVTSEALYHLLGGKKAGWKPMRMQTQSGTHWWLEHASGVRVDATARQFGGRRVPYSSGVGSGFLTKRPSKRARQLMETLVWQEGR